MRDIDRELRAAYWMGAVHVAYGVLVALFWFTHWHALGAAMCGFIPLLSIIALWIPDARPWLSDDFDALVYDPEVAGRFGLTPPRARRALVWASAAVAQGFYGPLVTAWLTWRVSWDDVGWWRVVLVRPDISLSYVVAAAGLVVSWVGALQLRQVLHKNDWTPRLRAGLLTLTIGTTVGLLPLLTGFVANRGAWGMDFSYGEMLMILPVSVAAFAAIGLALHYRELSALESYVLAEQRARAAGRHP